MTLIVYKYANNWSGVCTLKQYTDELVFDRNVEVLYRLDGAIVSDLQIDAEKNNSGKLTILFDSAIKRF